MARSNETKSEVIQKSIGQHSNNQFNWSCPVCLEEFNNDDCQQAFTSCGHSFCQNCLQRTLNIKPFCPLCRQYQQQDNQHSELIQLHEDIPWNPQVVRAFFSEERLDEDGRRIRTVHLSNGESTNIHVGRGVKINISPDSNLLINGKRIQNPSDCNQQ
jgi:hypothetical protein